MISLTPDEREQVEARIFQQPKKMKFMDYQINVRKVQARWYHTKSLKLYRLSKAALHRDDEIWDIKNINLVRRKVPVGEIKLDVEDDNHNNAVQYECNVDDKDA